MSFTEFLQWLFSKIGMILDWFGDRFNIYVNILNNIYSIIQGYIDRTIATVESKLTKLKQDIEGWFTDRYKALVDWINTTVSSVYTYISQQVTNLGSTLGGTINDVITFINGVQTYAYNLVMEVKTNLEGWVTSSIESAGAALIEPFKPLITLVTYVNKIVTFFAKDTQDKISYLFNTAIPFLVGIISNPVTFILDILSSHLISVVCWLLALSIGTTKDNIDVTPPWKRQ